MSNLGDEGSSLNVVKPSPVGLARCRLRHEPTLQQALEPLTPLREATGTTQHGFGPTFVSAMGGGGGHLVRFLLERRAGPKPSNEVHDEPR